MPEIARRPMYLDHWQSRQAAMLYTYLSAEYLAPVEHLVTSLIHGQRTTLLELARAQAQDPCLVSRVEGRVQVSRAWTVHAPRMFGEILRRVQRRRQYSGTRHEPVGLDGHLADLESQPGERMDMRYPFHVWASRAEEDVIELARRVLRAHLDPVDDTLVRFYNPWNDYEFAIRQRACGADAASTARLVVRTDLCADTGSRPPRDGVYICLDAPDAALQYAWSSAGGGPLLPANVFSGIGQAALDAVGRVRLWTDDGAMHAFAMSPAFRPYLGTDLLVGGALRPGLAPYAVSRAAFVSRAGTWALVDMLPDAPSAA